MLKMFGNVPYDSNDFEVKTAEDPEKMGCTQYLHYCGSETNGDRIYEKHQETFEKMEDASGLFMDTDVITPPPFGPNVKKANCTFANCRDLSVGVEWPDTVEEMRFTYDNCINMEEASLPDNVRDITGVCANNENLQVMNRIPDSVTHMSCAFEGCDNMERFEGGVNVVDAECAFAGCTNLKDISLDFASGNNAKDSEKNFTDMVIGCPDFKDGEFAKQYLDSESSLENQKPSFEVLKNEIANASKAYVKPASSEEYKEERELPNVDMPDMSDSLGMEDVFNS